MTWHNLSVSWRCGGWFLLSLGCGNCASQRAYTLPARGLTDVSLVEPLLECATEQNWQAERDGEQVTVTFEDGSNSQFNLALASRATYVLHFEPVASAATTATQRSLAQQRSETLFGCALNHARALPSAAENAAEGAPEAVPEAAENVTAEDDPAVGEDLSDVVPPSDSCAILASCYNDLASIVCHAGDATCRAPYRINDSDNTQACEAILTQLPQQLHELQKQRAHFSIPSSCSTLTP